MRFSNLGLPAMLALCVVTLAAGLINGKMAYAQVAITEIWQRGGSDNSSDWFELTNVSGGIIDPSSFVYTDMANDPTPPEGAALLGISNIAPGESVIYLVSWQDDFDDQFVATSAFQDFWGTNGAYQIGYALDANGEGGAGLSGGGDTVNVYDGNTLLATLLDSKTYNGDNDIETWVLNPGSGNLQLAEVGVLGAFESPGVSDDGSLSGSPGVFVPEPNSILILVLGAVGVWVRRIR